MSAIDIGAAAISRGYGTTSGYTYVLRDNPANDSGIITSVEVWAKTAMAGLRVGTFYLVSGTTYKCRDSATLGSVATGSKRTFSDLAIQVVVGDLIGFYATSGTLMLGVTGGAGYVAKTGEFIDAGDSTSFNATNNYIISLYGVGATSPLSGASFLLRMI